MAIEHETSGQWDDLLSSALDDTAQASQAHRDANSLRALLVENARLRKLAIQLSNVLTIFLHRRVAQPNLKGNDSKFSINAPPNSLDCYHSRFSFYATTFNGTSKVKSILPNCTFGRLQ